MYLCRESPTTTTPERFPMRGDQFGGHGPHSARPAMLPEVDIPVAVLEDGLHFGDSGSPTGRQLSQFFREY